ncbi:hypothetical protein GCM10020254_33630 [Streptomyces goshikiensis]
MRAAGLDHLGELGGLALQGGREVLQGRDQLAGDGGRRGDVDGGREHVVGALRGIDVVVGVDLAAEPLGGQGGDHLVDVHVGRGPGARLEHVDGEVLVPAALGDLGGGGADRLGEVLVHHTQARVHRGGRALDAGEGLDVGALQALPGDGEVLHGALGLGPPLGVRGDPYLSHRVVLDPVGAGGRTGALINGHVHCLLKKLSNCLVRGVPNSPTGQ